MSRRVFAITSLVAGLALAPASTGAGAELEGLDRCLAGFAAQPDAEESAKCFSEVAAGATAAARAAAVDALERLQARNPGKPWLLYYLGWLHWREHDRAAGQFAAAVEAFIACGDSVGELRARYNLAKLFDLSDRLEAAARERGRAMEIVERSTDPQVLAWGAIIEAQELRTEMRDLDRALAILVAKEPTVVLPDSPFALRKEWLLTAGNVALDLSRLSEATAYFRRLLDLSRAGRNAYLEATALYNLMISRFAELSQMPTPGARDELVGLARQALDVAAETRNADIESKTRLVLAMLSTGAEAREEGERCQEVTPSDRVRSYCLAESARGLADDDPAAALGMIDDAIEMAERGGDPWSRAFAWGVRMRVAWRAGSPSRAIEDSWAALDAIEVLRDLQTSTETRGEVFEPWADDYLWFAGRLLREYVDAGGGDELLAAAHQVGERMRARALVDNLRAAGAASHADGVPTDLQERFADALADVARARGNLLAPGLSPARREAAKAELQRAESEKARLRELIEGAGTKLGGRQKSRFATLGEVQQALRDDQALLSFVVAPQRELNGEPAGSGWLMVVTSDSVRAYPSLDRTGLRPAVGLFTGFFEPRDGEEARPAASFAEMLLSTALDDLPAEVDRLIVVPDDYLHVVPFAALRDGAGNALASRYQLTEVPSATLWLHWVRSRPVAAPVPALVLADPRLADEGGDGGGGSRAAGTAGTVRFERLWQSEPEGRAVVGYLGGGSVLRLRDDASEAFVKTVDLRRFTVLHFATHAVTDEEDPARSAVLLAPGAPGEDGLLRIREIVELDLEGRLVVLSSCRTASGEVVRGEGVMGLARAFFRSGAHTVVGSLWPLEDTEAALLFDRFYRHLADGESVAAALAAAQRDRIADGAPAAAWAGLVVLGDGDLVPVPGGVPRGVPGVWAAGGLTLGLVSLAVMLLVVRARRAA